MNIFYNKLHEITLLELELFKKEVLEENAFHITKEITLKNGLVIRISKWLTLDVFVKFAHKNDTNSYSFDELVATDYVPEKYQNLEFLETHSSIFSTVK